MNPVSSVAITVPLTVVIGPVPDDVNTAQAKVKFGLGHVSRILSDRGIQATLDNQRAVATISDGINPAETLTADGLKNLDQRVFQVQPAGDKHSLELSIDLGTKFTQAAVFSDFDLANAVGQAWVDGRIV